ncbi:MAG: sigma-54 dependent transcriptional regulator [Deltaproteobacteria bacterium]|jgi:two-component system response regulator FlrC|nr:sigma-54 dependent transcriptional regulator [Deltaproteobacteria bacterium]
MRAKYILVADGEKNMRQALFTALTRLGHAVDLAETGEEALVKVTDQRFDLVLFDLSLGRLSGEKFLKEAKKIRPGLKSIAMSANSGLDEAVGIMREGAQDFLRKPFPAGIIEECVARALVGAEESFCEQNASEDPNVRPIVFQSQIMKRLMALAQSIAKTNATVLLQGESGTGKELVARFIHSGSQRKDGPFVAINCAGLPESLLESELFGHEKGAFTGALNRKAGKFDLANGGTLLLDEISEMDISLQAKLLRALQEGEIDPVGGKGPHKVDVRVIATTNRRLKEYSESGRFRTDLYYRLNVMPIYLPALKERKEDILPLACYFVEKHASLNGMSVPSLSESALEFLENHDWPGNIRELENTVARAVLMTQGNVIESQDIFMDEPGFMKALTKNALLREAEELPLGNASEGQAGQAVSQEAEPAPLTEELVSLEETSNDPQDLRDPQDFGDLKDPGIPLMTIEKMERCLIGRALNATSGNRTHAARLLGISVRTLRNKLNEYRHLTENSQVAVG